MLLLAVLPLLVSAACDLTRALTQCLQVDLSACKKAANGDMMTECQCATTAQTCVVNADCAADASALATLQLGFVGSGCNLPESTALPAQGSACSTTGATYCYATLTRCGGENIGSGYPQPAVCGMCLDNYVACVVKYHCGGLGQIKTQFNSAVRGFRCNSVDDFDAKVAALTATNATVAGSTTLSNAAATSPAPTSLPRVATQVPIPTATGGSVSMGHSDTILSNACATSASILIASTVGVFASSVVW
jgi:hypothetical protein